MPQIKVRQASSPDDFDHIRTLFTAYSAYLADNPSGKANICIEGFEREIAGLPSPYLPPDGTLFLAHVDQSVAGCVALRSIHNPPQEERACEMKRLWVSPGFRGLNLGRRLAESAIGWARSVHFNAIYLDTVPVVMPSAHALYLDLGFQAVPRYNDNPVPDIVFLRLDLH